MIINSDRGTFRVMFVMKDGSRVVPGNLKPLGIDDIDYAEYELLS